MAMRLWYGSCNEWQTRVERGVADPGDIVDGNMHIARASVPRLREALAIPDLTPEQVEVASIEGKLEQARADGIIIQWKLCSWLPDNRHWAYSITVHGISWVMYDGHHRLDAARAALARVDELRAEAERKRLPEPESMTQHDREDELHKRGWEHCWAGPADGHHKRPAWCPPSGSGGEVVVCYDVNNWQSTTADALRQARRLDGDA